MECIITYFDLIFKKNPMLQNVKLIFGLHYIAIEKH